MNLLQHVCVGLDRLSRFCTPLVPSEQAEHPQAGSPSEGKYPSWVRPWVPSPARAFRDRFLLKVAGIRHSRESGNPGRKEIERRDRDREARQRQRGAERALSLSLSYFALDARLHGHDGLAHPNRQ